MSLDAARLPSFWQLYRNAVADFQTNPCGESRDALLKAYREWVCDFTPNTAFDLIAQMRRRIGA